MALRALEGVVEKAALVRSASITAFLSWHITSVDYIIVNIASAIFADVSQLFVRDWGGREGLGVIWIA